MRGSYTTEQAIGAIANGTCVVKVRTEAGDTHAIGARARVLGSVAAPPEVAAEYNCPYGYFVEWEDAAGYAVFVMGVKIAVDTERCVDC
jgi:hypothetical protein